MPKKAIAAVVVVLSLGGCATTRSDGAGHWAALTVMGPLEAGLLYHLRSDTPPDPRLAFAWGDVCGERDPAARGQALAAAQPRLEQAARVTADKDAWVLPLRHTMGAYDLKKGGFGTGLQTGSVIRFDRSDFCRQEVSFLVAFRNGSAYSVLHVSEDGARRLVRSNPARTVVHDLEVEVVGWQPGPPGPTLLVDIVRMRTRDTMTDRVVRDTALPEPR
jgi:hypothetical protein